MEIKPIIETYGCAITTDIWTEDYHKTSFISSTIHYTNDDFAFVLRVLFAAPFENGVSKTGENIRNLLFQKLRAFGIDTSLLVGHVVFVTDRGANVVAALHGYTRLNCKLCILNVILSCAFAPDLESENSSPSASLALPWSVRHLEHCQAASLEPVLSEVASVCASCLEEVMGTSDTSANPLHMIYRIATFLTPKMRCCAQKQEMTWSKVKFDQVLATAQDEPPPAKKQSCSDRFTDWEDGVSCISAPKVINAEIAEYLGSRLEDKPDPENVLQWWKFNKERFPVLSKCVRFILRIPASSAPSERAFSVCGRILEDRRTSLGPQSVSNILFLHSNMK
ncbi:Transposable element Hobo transposase [Labeo rohita]|uniref:Transposable element Hobo transposase n=1 Tax=Labeo rohita TaxID=84645 RepID=A0ABQ8L590_LABRO|nr:Transposable element Hobo transposase [Labeo rohita]